MEQSLSPGISGSTHAHPDDEDSTLGGRRNDCELCVLVVVVLGRVDLLAVELLALQVARSSALLRLVLLVVVVRVVIVIVTLVLV